MKEYYLTFKLKKHKDARPFIARVKASDDADIQGIKEEWGMYYEEMFNTSVKCVKVEYVSGEVPHQEEANERKKKKQTKVGSSTD